jgi:hypothetical protein
MPILEWRMRLSAAYAPLEDPFASHWNKMPDALSFLQENRHFARHAHSIRAGKFQLSQQAAL